MPTSTVLQLIARGRQDDYLTGNPQFTFFRQVYRRYTPFAIESIPIELDGTLQFGQRLSCLIPRKAELLSSLFLELDLPPIPEIEGKTYYWVNDIGHALIRDVSIEIGEKEIDKQTGEWMKIWGELTTPAGLTDGYNAMVGHTDDYPAGVDPTATLHLQIPLRFWFCRTIGLALPLIALQSHPVRIIFHLRPFNDLWWSTNINACAPPPPVQPTRLQLYGDYIFLDSAERREFAARDHEYLIEQIQTVPPQTVPAGVNSVNVPLMVNHPCKEFIWVIQQTCARENHEWFNYSNKCVGDSPGSNPQELMETAILRLDGYDRFYRRSARYFRITQPYQRHTNVPWTPLTYIYVYSMSLHPEAEQPSGSLNASKIDDITWNLAFNPAALDQERTISFFVPNYNVLRIVGGLGGLAFIS
jgi:hypothetical protein